MRPSVRLLGACGCLLLSGCAPDPQQVDQHRVAQLSGPTMGTQYTVKVRPPPPPHVRADLAARISARLQAVNRMMSTYLPDSDLSRFNRSRSTAWQAMPAAIPSLVERAAEISVATGGAYDVTVGPLVALWGFGNAGDRTTPPHSDDIDAARARVGYRKLDTRMAPPALRKQVAGLEVDLSSIAKGWGVDQVAELLEADGIDNYLVDIGGDMRVRGSRGLGQPWRIAIERPGGGRQTVQRLVALNDGAVATSGDYRNYFEHAGVRYSHTIDPRSGDSVAHRLASVTVFADDATDADAWATALLALGEDLGPAVAERLQIAALFIARGDGGLVERISPALSASGLLGR